MPITIAGWELHPEAIVYRPAIIGGPIRRALDGTGYRKVVSTKHKLELSWSVLDADEMQAVRIVFEQAKGGSVTVTCLDPVISGSFLLADEELPFDSLEGSQPLWRGSLRFEER